jgi:hypothetical protein
MIMVGIRHTKEEEVEGEKMRQKGSSTQQLIGEAQYRKH